MVGQSPRRGSSEELEPLIDAIDASMITEEAAVNLLSVVLEAVIDHNAEYRDYNSTTTQSDRGEMLYMLLDFLRLRVRYDRVCWTCVRSSGPTKSWYEAAVT